MDQRSGVCLVTTLLLPPGGHGPVSSFIRWHLHLGFERLYLYFDDVDSREEYFPVGWEECGNDSRVERIRRSKSLVEEQRRVCKSFERFGPFVDTEVQARQVLNAEHASLLAQSRGLRWIVHIDIDELFYVQSRQAFLSHFVTLERENVEHVTYANHEGVPTSSEDEKDYFKAVTLFRVNHMTIPMTHAAMEAMAWWKKRTLRGQYLLCYDNGKSALRLRPDVASTPTSVHGWTCSGKRKTALADPRSLSVGEVDTSIEPCILHYVTCGKFWLRTKYEILGKFDDAWFGGTLPIAKSFHLDARDVVLKDKQPFDEFYRTHVQAPADPQLVRRHLAAGVLRRYIVPAQVLGGQSSVEKEVPVRTTTMHDCDETEDLKTSSSTASTMTTTTNPQGYEKAWILASAANSFL